MNITKRIDVHCQESCTIRYFVNGRSTELSLGIVGVGPLRHR